MTDEQLLNNYDVYLKLTKTKKIYVGICQKDKEISRTNKASWTKNWTYFFDYSSSQQKYIMHHNGLGGTAAGTPEHFRKMFDAVNNYIINAYLKHILIVENCLKIKVDDIKLMLLKLHLKEFKPDFNDEYHIIRISVKDFISCPIKIDTTEQTKSASGNKFETKIEINNNKKLFLLI